MARLFTEAAGTGNENFVDFGDQTEYDITSDITFGAWIYRTAQVASGSTSGIVSKYLGAGNNRSYALSATASTDDVQFVLSTDGTFQAGNTITASGVLSNSTWIHLAARLDASTRQSIYVDGSENGGSVKTSSVAASIYSGTSALQLGLDFYEDGDAQAHQHVFPGRICESFVYAAALDGAEIAALALGYSPLLIRPTSLQFYCPVMGTESAEPDIVNGYDGTIHGTANKAEHTSVIYPGAGMYSPPATVPAGIPEHFMHYSSMRRI
jgi:hypothetical protein